MNLKLLIFYFNQPIFLMNLWEDIHTLEGIFLVNIYMNILLGAFQAF